MFLTSKYNGICTACGHPYAVGDRVEWIPSQQGARHQTCSTDGKEVASKVAESRATNADIDIPCPEDLSYLPFQKAGISYALNHKNTLIADEMGLGKTIQAIGFINARPDIRTVLIVCPASLRINWENELKTWLSRPLDICQFPNECVEDGITIINYDILKKMTVKSHDLMILDESHYIKNPKAKRTVLAQLMARAATHVLCLSGTPILAKPVELFPILQLVAPEEFDPPGIVKGCKVSAGQGGGFFRYAKRYCNAHQEWVGRKMVWDFNGASNLDTLQEKLRTTCMVRRLKKDVLKELPAKRRQVIVLPNDNPLAEDDPRLDDINPDNYDETISALRAHRVAFEEISRVRHEEATAKVSAAIDFIKESLESSEKIVVFAHHHDVIDSLIEGLKDYGVVSITGDTDKEKRADIVSQFQENKQARLFIGSITAAGTGITLTAASHVIFVELDWTPGNVSQAEDRCHRIGQLESVLIQHLVVDHTLDAKIARILIKKQAILDKTLDAEPPKYNPPTPSGPQNGIPSNPKTDLLSADEIAQIHDDLRTLAGMCDGAVQRDGHGFNKLDAAFGMSLANVPRLSQRQALAAKKMLIKYHKQLGK